MCMPFLHSSLYELKLRVGFGCFVEWYKYIVNALPPPLPPPVLFFNALRRSLVSVSMCTFERTCGCNDLSHVLQCCMQNTN